MPNRPLMLLPCILAAAALLAAPPAAQPAFAAAVPDAAAQADTAPDAGNPPARVARLARITGAVSYHTTGEDHWIPAITNYPVTSGESFWTEPQAQAQIELGANAMVMNEATEFDVSTLDAHTLTASLPQGELFLSLRDVPAGDAYAISTPRGVVRISQPGLYDLVAGDTETPTTVTVQSGAAEITGPGLSVQLAANQTATITGTETFQASTAPAAPTAFMTAMLSQFPATVAALQDLPPAVQQMTGCADLSRYGRWQQTQEYGQVWYPNVGADWAPYRDGSWSYVAPWGWTWIDSEPWGFAPFHYGRWAQIGGAWGWVPVLPGVTIGIGFTPVYAPAVVSFVGFGAVGWGRWGGFGPPVGWVPLAPREPFHPWYRATPNYVRRINVLNVTNIRVVNNFYRNARISNFANHRAATFIPAAAMAHSRPVQSVREPVTAARLARARVLAGRNPVRPVADTVGLTPAAARRLNVGSVHHAVAPGPAIRAAAAGEPAHHLPGLRQHGGALAAAAGGAPHQAGEAIHAAPGPAIQHHLAGLPGLRPHAAQAEAAHPAHAGAGATAVAAGAALGANHPAAMAAARHGGAAFAGRHAAAPPLAASHTVAPHHAFTAHAARPVPVAHATPHAFARAHAPRAEAHRAFAGAPRAAAHPAFVHRAPPRAQQMPHMAARAFHPAAPHFAAPAQHFAAPARHTGGGQARFAGPHGGGGHRPFG